jgi:hypothetical protein
VFGTASVFLFRLPGKPEDNSIDFEMAQDEVNAELKAEQQEKMEENREEEEFKMKEIEDKYEEERQVKKEEEEKERKQQEEKIKALEELKNEQAEDAEKNKVEEQKKALMKEMMQKEQERLLSEQKMMEEKEEKKRLLERKRKDHQRLDEMLNTLLPMVKEANLSAEELKRKFTFEPTVVHEVDDKPGQSPLEQLKNSKSKVVVEVTNKEDGYKYKWDPEKFSDRLYIMRDVMDEFFNTGTLPNLSKDEDPFWDPQEAMLIGRAYFYLKSLGYMIDNQVSCKIMNTNASGN